MSKMDNLRAMREARYAQGVARAATGEGTAKKSTTPAKPVGRRLATRPAAAGPPQAATAPVARRQATRPAAADPAPAAADPAPAPAAAADAVPDELCGHRNMSGRTCTREQGHSAKSHRYS